MDLCCAKFHIKSFFGRLPSHLLCPGSKLFVNIRSSSANMKKLKKSNSKLTLFTKGELFHSTNNFLSTKCELDSSVLTSDIRGNVGNRIESGQVMRS